MISFRIIDSADQKFSKILNNRRVTFRLRFNHTSRRWSMDLAIDGDYVLHGRRIVPNVDLIEPFNFGIGVIFAFSHNGDQPGRKELVDGRVKIYQTSEAEKNAVTG